MGPASPQPALQHLRKALAGIDPSLGPGLTEPEQTVCIGVPDIDVSLGGGLPRGALHEISPAAPMHLAAALHVPVVALFGPTDPARNGPFSTKSIVLRHTASRTSLSHRSEPDSGLLAITPNDVLAAANKLLETPRG